MRGADIPKEQIEAGIEAEEDRLKEQEHVDRAFNKFFFARRNVTDLTRLQELWLAFEAGAQFAINRLMSDIEKRHP